VIRNKIRQTTVFPWSALHSPGGALWWPMRTRALMLVALLATAWAQQIVWFFSKLLKPVAYWQCQTLTVWDR